MRRNIAPEIRKDLERKMVLVTGPRQSGKTWLCKEVGKLYRRPVYLNYDRAEDRRVIANESWLGDTDLVILDELHKMPDWKNYAKGIFDTKPASLHLLITGSSRLEAFAHAGDSMAGRYFTHRLLPFSPAEVRGETTEVDLRRFLSRGGFPEPYLAESDIDADRWRRTYIDDLIRVDVLDFEKIHDFKAIQLVLSLLRRRVGSPVSYRSIAEDVGISPNTVKKYISIFEDLYIIFRVTPYSNSIARSLLKEPKIYFFDNGLVDGDDGARFENLAAFCLMKHVFHLQDSAARNLQLHYLRTKDGLEVDFCLAEDGKAVQMIEAKFQDTDLAPALRKFHAKHGIPAVQLVCHLKREQSAGGIELRRGYDFLSALAT